MRFDRIVEVGNRASEGQPAELYRTGFTVGHWSGK